MRILVFEGDPALASFLQHGFVAENYSLDLAGDGDAANYLLRQHDYDLAILDLSPSRPEGSEILRQVRARRLRLPILVLINSNCPDEGVRALDRGADDFVTKPFEFLELSARVRALLRRSAQLPEAVLSVEDLELNRVERRVMRANCAIRLTPKEFSLLEFLMNNVGHPVSRQEIIAHVWNSPGHTVTNLVDVYINYVRKKVDATSQHKLIRTVRGIGYQLRGREGAQDNVLRQ